METSLPYMSSVILRGMPMEDQSVMHEDCPLRGVLGEDT